MTENPRLHPRRYGDGFSIAGLRRGTEPGPKRTEQLLTVLVNDAGRLDLQPRDCMPPEVAEAWAAFDQAVSQARAAIAAVQEASAKTAQAHEADVLAAAALNAGKPAPRLTRREASEAEEMALVQCVAAEEIVMAAHVKLTDTVRTKRKAWRAALVKRGEEAHEYAADRLAEAQEYFTDRATAYTSAMMLDDAVAARYQEAVPGYDSRQLQYNTLTGPNARGVGEAFAALTKHLSQPLPWEQKFDNTPRDYGEMVARHVAAQAAEGEQQ